MKKQNIKFSKMLSSSEMLDVLTLSVEEVKVKYSNIIVND
jgi:hypothetical protein